MPTPCTGRPRRSTISVTTCPVGLRTVMFSDAPEVLTTRSNWAWVVTSRLSIFRIRSLGIRPASAAGLPGWTMVTTTPCGVKLPRTPRGCWPGGVDWPVWRATNACPPAAHRARTSKAQGPRCFVFMRSAPEAGLDGQGNSVPNYACRTSRRPRVAPEIPQRSLSPAAPSAWSPGELAGLKNRCATIPWAVRMGTEITICERRRRTCRDHYLPLAAWPQAADEAFAMIDLRAAWLLLIVPAAGAAPAVEYVKDVKPLLTRSCIGCHGPSKQRGGLRLDTVAGLKKGGDSGPALVAGKSAASRLAHALTGANDVLIMPPRQPRLSPAEVALIKRWIDEGAQTPAAENTGAAARAGHWPFLPIRRPAPPAVKRTDWVRNSIDAFILARLEKQDIAPSPEADRPTLLRRLALDLTGLPPTPEAVDAFVRDRSPDAYEKVVDRLLASPHYGERMAWEWLDAARYADSNGYQGDGERTMWPWRDWVVDALNRNLPFDQFTLWHLAGDLLPEPTFEQRLATGFCRNHMINGEGGRIPEENRIDYLFDQTETLGTVWLGATLNCTRCHDHKYDP